MHNYNIFIMYLEVPPKTFFKISLEATTGIFTNLRETYRAPELSSPHAEHVAAHRRSFGHVSRPLKTMTPHTKTLSPVNVN